MGLQKVTLLNRQNESQKLLKLKLIEICHSKLKYGPDFNGI